MIPSLVAAELRDALLDYLETTFSLSDPRVGAALRGFLTDPEEGIFKGPWVDVRLPFRTAPADADIPLKVRPPYAPYLHQLVAWRRLSGAAPRNTLVTTGTGSGKTECFLYPILDACAVDARPGIKAILLYPMNALASDQSRRLAEEIDAHPTLKGRVTAGLYVGQSGDETPQKAMSKTGIITCRETLRRHPPDILLTNYRMLDLLLLRKEDQALWAHNDPEGDLLSYLVLDELHTYDGAQGSDVACLLRRLKARLRRDGALACVGTSATLGDGDADAADRLQRFAGRLFGAEFGLESIVTEDRLSAAEILPTSPLRGWTPAPDLAPIPEDGEALPDFTRRLAAAWLGTPEEGGPEGDDPVAIGAALLHHGAFQSLLTRCGGRPRPWEALCDALAKDDPDIAAATPSGRSRQLRSLLALMALARRAEGERRAPLVTCMVQVWVRELRRVSREVRPTPRFFWRDDVPLEGQPRGLPPVYCRECGHSGWVAWHHQRDNSLKDDPRRIYEGYFRRSRNISYVFPAPLETDGALTLFDTYLCPCCLRILEGPRGPDGTRAPPPCPCGGGDDDDTRPFPIHLHAPRSKQTPPRDLQRCPACSTDYALTILGSQAASLSSVAISHYFLSPRNTEKKLLAFTDSVQDASHRAGFFGARGYRITLRTALQRTIEARGPLRLSELGEGVVETLRAQGWPELGGSQRAAAVVAALTPPDLIELPEYQAFMEAPSRDGADKVLWRLKKRLQWEAAMEMGHNSRVGRTLEKVGAAGAAVDVGALSRATRALLPRIHEELGAKHVDERHLRHFLDGLLERTRSRGGVAHPFLRGYAQEMGAWFLLTKQRQPLMSPFGSRSRRPRALTDRAEHDVFDAIVTSSSLFTWPVDWAKRALDVRGAAGSINDLYREAMDALVAEGLLVDWGPTAAKKKGKGAAYLIPPEALLVSAEVERLQCPVCGDTRTLPRPRLKAWMGMPCLGYRCGGRYAPSPRDTGAFYRRIYRSGAVERVFPSEHTGLLPSGKRKSVEEGFQRQPRRDSPNLLTCTPTLEMGIDVGDLSGTFACSVPPTTANYLQRIGRAGRKTGNAVVMTLATAQPHDLYFFGAPEEMLAGEVSPPGCFLDAPEMLKRQLLAAAWDHWAAHAPEAGPTPRQIRQMIAQHRAGAWSAAVAAWALQHQEIILGRFLEDLGEEVSEEAQGELRRWLGAGELGQALEDLVRALEEEIGELRREHKRLKDRKERIEANPGAHDDAEGQVAEHDDEITLLLRMIRALEERYPLQVLAERGLLPNYAFPEEGVRLRAVVGGARRAFEEKSEGQAKATRKDYTPYEWLRPGGAALQELAPFNTFYAEGMKVTIDQVDVGGLKRSRVESWILCERCQFVSRAQALPEGTKVCPRCGAPGLHDTGRRHDMLALGRVSSRSDYFSSRVGDEAEDRERRTYHMADLFDVEPACWRGGYLDGRQPFGFELLHNVALRQVNFGPEGPSAGKQVTVAGESVPEVGFTVCADCGVVKPPPGDKRTVRHRFACTLTGQGRKEQWRDVYLYREKRSDAIRLLLPVSGYETDAHIHTFSACLALGLRRRFEGQPIHLTVRRQVEPLLDGGARQFLVVYDDVPGGTGFLRDLSTPEGFKGLLEAARGALAACACRLKEGRDGCYRCIFAYQDQRVRQHLSRTLGLEMLGGILKGWESLQQVETLSNVSVDAIQESELERRLIAALDAHPGTKGALLAKVQKATRHGKESRAILTREGGSWHLEPQVNLSASQVAIPSMPDAVLWPEGPAGQPSPIALFADGFKYHAHPGKSESRIPDDIEKRRAIWDAPELRCMTVVWGDVDLFAKGHRLQGEALLNQAEEGWLAQRLKATGSPLPADLYRRDGLTQTLMALDPAAAHGWGPYGALWGMSLALHTQAQHRGPEVRAYLRRLLTGIALPEVPEAAPGDSRLVVKRFGALTLACAVLGGDAKAGPWIVLRLEDDEASRQAQGYRDAWALYWRLANVLQGWGRFRATSTSVAANHPEDGHLGAPPQPYAAAPGALSLVADGEGPPAAPPPHESGLPEGPWREAWENCPNETRPVVRALYTRTPHPPTAAWFQKKKTTIQASATLAWPARRVALLLPEERYEGEHLLAPKGWRCHVLEEEGDGGAPDPAYLAALASALAESLRDAAPDTAPDLPDGEGS